MYIPTFSPMKEASGKLHRPLAYSHILPMVVDKAQDSRT